MANTLIIARSEQRTVAATSGKVITISVTLAAIVGGRASSDIVNDTWEWDGNVWTQRTVSGPAARWQVVMAAR
jgi:hypothetical protein